VKGFFFFILRRRRRRKIVIESVDIIENGTVVPITAIRILRLDGLLRISLAGIPNESMAAELVSVWSVTELDGEGNESPTIELNEDGSTVVGTSLFPKAV
jgi:hypothetical protein